MDTKDFSDMQIKFEAIKDDGNFAGYGSVFDNIDLTNDVIQRGAFLTSLQKFDDQKKMPVLWQHDSTEPLGVYTSIKEDSRGLFVEGRLNLDVQKAREAHSLLKQGAVTGLSIGYKVKNYDILRSGVRVIKELDLFEISLVTFPANDAARVTDVKAADIRTLRELEKVLRDAGLSRSDAKTIASGFQPKEKRDDQRDAVSREEIQQKLDQFCKLIQES